LSKESLEGGLEAPTRHALDWKSDDFYAEAPLFEELQRVFDICHGCRRCFNLCNAFPTLFNAVDESETMEVDGVPKPVYWEVVDNCYLCDICYMSKCPYVPPHEWYSGTAALPEYHSNTARRRLARLEDASPDNVRPTAKTRGKVVLYTTCYGNRNHPAIDEDLVAVFEHNGIPMALAEKESCCGMPKLELGDLESVAKAKQVNIPILAAMVDDGWDIVTPIPSCTLMFKQELPLMFPDDADVAKVRDAMFDPFEYLMLRHKDGELKTRFATSLGKVAYQVPCHLRVQNIGLKTRDILQLVPDTTVDAIERCSGHDGTYAVKKEFHEISKKIARPVVNKVKKGDADHFISDCPMAAEQIAQGLAEHDAEHPMGLLRQAYGI